MFWWEPRLIVGAKLIVGARLIVGASSWQALQPPPPPPAIAGPAGPSLRHWTFPTLFVSLV